MSVQIFKLTKIIKGILLIIVCPLGVLAQANTPPVGTSTNLCPGQTYRYTSGAANDGGLCNRLGGWIVENGKITSDGVGSNSSVWADVQWDNASSGRIGNFCGVLTVSINSISQPTMSGSSTVSLCGTGSITLQAAVASTANIASYVWNITGTGVTPTGFINTTSPQITINYSNWSSGSALSAAVAVGARQSCGFTTRTTPLVAIDPIPGIPNSGVPAIPRSAWVQLSPGNVNDLQAPLNFRVLLPDGSPSASTICSSGTVGVTNQPSGSNLSWSSANTSQLTINSNSGAVTRQNNYNGSVVVTASLSNACGSVDQTTSIWLGLPSRPGDVSGSTSPSIGGIYTYFSSSPSQGATSYNWTLPFGGNPLWSQNGGNINGIINTLTPSLFVGSSSGWLQAFGVNVCGNSSPSRLRVIPVGGGGGGQQQRIAFPNPANENINLKLKEEESEDETEIVLINKNMEKVLSKITKEKEILLPLNGIPDGIYYLNISNGKERTQRQIVVKH
jgi:Secretion system C-terminal sorting domain